MTENMNAQCVVSKSLPKDSCKGKKLKIEVEKNHLADRNCYLHTMQSRVETATCIQCKVIQSEDIDQGQKRT